MKMLNPLTLLAFIVLAFAPIEARADSHEGLFRHAVFFKFKDGTSEDKVVEIEKAFKALKGKVPTIVDFEWGRSESVEGLNDEFTHCFFVTFKDKAGLETYIPHKDHVAFVDLAKPHFDKVFVFDYTAKH